MRTVCLAGIAGRGWHISGWPCCYIDRCLAWHAWSALDAKRHYQRPLPTSYQPGHPGLCVHQGRLVCFEMTSSNAASCAYDNPIGLYVITAPSVVCR